MSNANLFFSFVLVLVFLSCDTPQERARNYNNEIVLVLTEAGLVMQQLDESLLNQIEINNRFEGAKKKVDSCQKVLNEIGLYEKDTTLVYPANRVIEVYQKLLSTQYRDLVQFHTLPSSDITFDLVDSTRVLRMEIQNESTFVQRDFENAQQSFADRYTLKLVE
jgi:hypothetical protein